MDENRENGNRYIAEKIGAVGLMLVAAYLATHGMSNFWVWFMFALGLLEAI